MQQAITQWEIYTHTVQHPPTISGRVRILRGAYSPSWTFSATSWSTCRRRIHDADQRYPVVYMQDGQNLFDAGTAFGGQEWHVDENDGAARHRRDRSDHRRAYHGGEKRIQEYNPFPHVWRGKGSSTSTGCATRSSRLTAISARSRNANTRASSRSSMGGLISMYAFFHRSETFGFAG
ncbi:MAG: hypothetical protein IPK17_39520 [Chloroflexi bacterium]|uniref:hypothetical protein n=1 Tax=Candidatus Flexifilum breve TaxID=3140694 RepID=UPI0031350284|nr:hypothetical protein [Chloroflexota bacterium]